MTIKGTGIDIVECDRFERLLLKEAFLKGVFSDYERAYIRSKKKSAPQTAAGIFCAKEAILKSCGVGIFGARLFEMEIRHNDSGKPGVRLYGQAKKQFSGYVFELSISHCRQYAASTVIAFRPDNTETEK